MTLLVSRQTCLADSETYYVKITAESSQRRNLVICLCLAIVTAAAYYPVCHFGFIDLDDSLYITENPRMQGGLTLQNLIWALTTREIANWHPLTWFSLMLDYRVFGAWAGGYHLVNVLLHIANTLLLFVVLERMTATPWRSAWAAALFALHPLHVESVVWVAERKDVLSTCFWLLTMWAYVQYGKRVTGHGSGFGGFYGVALFFFALGLMAKPMLVTLPFVLLLLDYWPLGRTRWAKPVIGERTESPMSHLVREKLPFVALAAGSCVVTYWAQHGGGAVLSLANLPLGVRIANALLSYVGYVSKMFWPVGLAVFYPIPPKLAAAAALGAGIGLVGVTAAVIWRARREPWLATGWFWYLGTLVPVLGLVQVGGQSMADRFTYIPLVGLFMMLCWSLPCSRIERRILRATACVGAGAVLVLCAVLCRNQVGYWKDSETLFRHALKVTRSNWLAHFTLGFALGEAGRPEEAIRHYEQALQIYPDYAEAHYNLGIALEQAGRLPEAIGHYEQALQIKPDYAEARNNLGNALVLLDRLPEAMGHLEQALRIKPDCAEAHNNLGNVLAGMGRLQDAIAHYEQALRINSNFAMAHYNLGISLRRQGKVQEAIGHFEQALRIKPDFTEAQDNLALARAAQ